MVNGKKVRSISGITLDQAHVKNTTITQLKNTTIGQQKNTTIGQQKNTTIGQLCK
jgi:hypothetical protein